ncbi:MAG: phosphoribosylformylglycinamidine synthase subunit PurQ [Alphaproteobacteria bacterium]|nr:phosphoribosylformylglycinamidine synthase subunit PurQ [Alphaproteobacteria bacterium]
MKSSILVFPGTNRERDVAHALVRAGSAEPAYVWHHDTSLPPSDLIVVPGGFAHGDYLRCGAMAARSPIMPAVIEAAAKGVPILGICNGFQVLCESGLLPGALMRNAALKFVCRDVTLEVATSDSPFTHSLAKGHRMTVPVAHHDGNYFADPETLKALEDGDRVAFRYVDNPNGSINDIAGILSENRRVLGMMPHPENATDPKIGRIDGQGLFTAIATALEGAAA